MDNRVPIDRALNEKLLMDCDHDFMMDSRVRTLGLSVSDFRAFLLEEGYVTQFDLDTDPSIVSQLMTADDVWLYYDETRESQWKEKQAKERVI